MSLSTTTALSVPLDGAIVGAFMAGSRAMSSAAATSFVPSPLLQVGAAAAPASSLRGTMPVYDVNTSRGFSSAAEPARAPQFADELSTPDSAFHNMKVGPYVEANYTPYNGDQSFLAKATDRTKKLWAKIEELNEAERAAGGVLDVDPSVPSTITAFPAGYIDKDLEVIVGLQTDKPFKRAIKPYGGLNMVKSALAAYNREIDPAVDKIFSTYRKTHNEGVFDAYTDEMKAARKSGILTGLPDGYGRGRIIGDYRRIALFGVDALIDAKKKDLKTGLLGVFTEDKIRVREEVADQIKALNELKAMAKTYGHDIAKPAKTAQEAVQWLYYGYLGAVKEQDGAAMSLGRIDAFLDTYFEKDLKAGLITEEQAQEIIDSFVVKLRIVKQLRTPEYNNLFAGDPTWVTVSIGGINQKGNHMVTKTAFRILHTLRTLGPAPEPNLTVLWSKNLPENFKKLCAELSIETSSIQYENDDMMSPTFGSDYGIACCVSAMRIGKDMQFFGARANLPKLMLYTMNNGRDEVSGAQIAPKFPPLKGDDKTPLDYNELKGRLEQSMDWLAFLYSNTMNTIHFMHDKYAYERLQMALHDTNIHRFLAFGISGLSVVTDSLSAIKYAKVYPIRNKDGLAVDFRVEGEYPKYGNDDPRVDSIAQWIVSTFSNKLQKQHAYRKAQPTLSALTITSNVVYGRMTGTTPDGRKKGEPFAPGANPMHGRDVCGALASLNSVASLPYDDCMDGISNTFSTVPSVLGKTPEAQVDTLKGLLDGYFVNKGHHLNVNVLKREMLLDAVEHPEKYPNLTIRVSGYAVHFTKLTKDQQMEVISRTFHDHLV